MVKITVRSEKGKKELFAQPGESVLEALRKSGIYVPANCGGLGTCRKCKVRINGKTILACGEKIAGDLEVELLAKDAAGLEASFGRIYEVLESEGFGIALDLGTTTVAAYLLDLRSGREIDRTSGQNRQISFGADVITRIKKASEGALTNLQKTIVLQINEMIAGFRKKNNFPGIKKMVIAGNTTMLHILAKADPSPLGVAPYRARFLDRKIFKGEVLGLDAEEVVLLPAVSAFIGGDIVSGLLACDVYRRDENILFCDFGTNGEIILKTKAGIFGTSTAAGPAFEGARIDCGMAGITGAAAKIEAEAGELKIHTIGDGELKGICGSGLVDLIYLLLKEGVIDETGAFVPESSSPLAGRLWGDKFHLSEDVYLSQRDIREFQLAKSAIASGIRILIDESGLGADEIDIACLAGGFGFYINKENAIGLGLLPESLKEKTLSVGNSSGLGAKMALTNPAHLEECDLLARSVQVVELANNQKFSEHFMDNMLLKEMGDGS